MSRLHGWWPLIIFATILLIGGWFVSMEIKWHFGLVWQIAWMPVEMCLGGLLGWFGSRHAYRVRGVR